MNDAKQRVFETVIQVKEELKGDTIALVGYGSVARGTESADSDFDLLQLSNRPRRPYQLGKVNVSVYTPEFLSRMARMGSLFVLHLRTEGIIVADADGRFAGCLSAYRAPKDYSQIREDLRLASKLLAITEEDYTENWISYGRVSLFILRTILFAEAAERNSPTFSISKIAEQKKDQRIGEVYAEKYLSHPSWKHFLLKRDLISEYLSCEVSSVVSPETFMLQHQDNELVVSLVYRLIGKSKPFDFYLAVREHMSALRNDKPSSLDARSLGEMF